MHFNYHLITGLDSGINLKPHLYSTVYLDISHLVLLWLLNMQRDIIVNAGFVFEGYIQAMLLLQLLEKL